MNTLETKALKLIIETNEEAITTLKQIISEIPKLPEKSPHTIDNSPTLPPLYVSLDIRHLLTLKETINQLDNSLIWSKAILEQNVIEEPESTYDSDTFFNNDEHLLRTLSNT